MELVIPARNLLKGEEVRILKRCETAASFDRTDFVQGAVKKQARNLPGAAVVFQGAAFQGPPRFFSSKSSYPESPIYKNSLNDDRNSLKYYIFENFSFFCLDSVL